MIVAIAIDGSEHSERAFNSYVQHCHKSENLVVLVHAAEFMFTGSLPMSPNTVAQLCDREEEETGALKAKYQEKMNENKIQGKWVVVRDAVNCGEGVIQAAKEHEAGMIVVGTRGLGTLRRTILGSVSDYILHHADVPVVICRKPKEEK